MDRGKYFDQEPGRRLVIHRIALEILGRLAGRDPNEDTPPNWLEEARAVSQGSSMMPPFNGGWMGARRDRRGERICGWAVTLHHSDLAMRLSMQLLPRSSFVVLPLLLLLNTSGARSTGVGAEHEFSQGGHIVPIAATRSDRTRRAVNRVHRLLIEYGLTGEGWEKYRTAREDLLDLIARWIVTGNA